MFFTMHVYDRYNWDQGKSVSILGIKVKDEQLGRLHRVGLAREFDVKGQSSPKFVTWGYTPGSSPGADSGQAPQSGAREGGRSDPGRDRDSYRGDLRGSPGAPRGR
jgi:hypothetical protein